ncbi:MAG: 5'-3' exonuclease H3TH domain-containing protein [Verrucomicrobiota bacterium]
MDMNSQEQVAGKFLIVDGHAYAYRAFFAIRRLNAPDGKPTNAIYGFIKMLTKMQDWIQPTHQIVLWDGGLAEQRLSLLPEYKAQRVEMPSDLEQQLDEITAYLRAANVTSWCEKGIEADDLIATVAKCAVQSNLSVVIASADKDFLQLVSPRVSLLNPNDKSEVVWDERRVLEKTGVKPEQIVDWLSLMGDSVDNIPGVTGVGPKTATELLKQFGNNEELYRRLPEVKSERLRGNLAAATQHVERNRSLIRLHADLPCDFDLEKLCFRSGDVKNLQELFARWGFRGMLSDLEKEQTRQTDLFGEIKFEK